MTNDRKKFNKRGPRPEREFDQKIVDLARVTRVMAGGKRMSFRACVAIGDRKGKIGIGLAKGADVTLAVTKAVNRAKKKMVKIPIINDTIPHELRIKYKAAKLLLKPAPKGTGIKAGGAVRVVLELAGTPNIVCKILGTNNKVTNVKALLKAMESFKVTEKQAEKKHVVKKEEVKKEDPSAPLRSAQGDTQTKEVKKDIK
ncbi:30S ribosomal protein S5 [Candidatus Kuenenbacteria bacterium]|nr:30S ribosomal protein S5 [Candidatus Kuenenbacteria bacterium]